jgi:hypothetical protein
MKWEGKGGIMINSTQKIGVLLILAVLVSCSSSPKAADSEASASDESSTVYRSSEGDTSDVRMVTYTVSLRLDVKDIEETRKSLVEQVNTYKGYIVMETDTAITTRIPNTHMENFLTDARKLGKIDYERKTGRDITDQYRDDVLRLDSLKNVRNRYLALLEKANNVNDILTVEKELERINTQIEVLEGKIKYAELSTAYSNITVVFREKAKPGPIGWIFYGLFRGIKWLFVWN